MFKEIFIKQIQWSKTTCVNAVMKTYFKLKDRLQISLLIWHKVFKRRLSKFCGRQQLKNLKRRGLLKEIISLQIL